MLLRSLTTLAVLLACIPCSAGRKGPIKALTLDAEAEVVELFSATEAGRLRVRIITKDARHANLFIENTTSDTLTVGVPPAITAVHVLKQFQPFPNQPPIGVGNNPNQLNTGNGQTVGGPLNPANGPFPQIPGGNGPGANFPQGLNFFSIPAERSVWLKVDSVCLDHGKPNPKPQMTYVVVPAEKTVESPVLRRLLVDFNAKTGDRDALQAAAWHFANDKSWDELERLPVRRNGFVQPYFRPETLKKAREMVEAAEKRVEKEGDGLPRVQTRTRKVTSIE